MADSDGNEIANSDYFSPYIKKRYSLSESKLEVVNGKLQTEYLENLPPGESVLKWFYEVLGVLDSKSSALMRLNGVMVAAASFLLGPANASTWIKILISLSALCSSISIFLCLFVVSVTWPFLGRASVTSPDSAERVARVVDFTKEFSDLDSTINRRVKLYKNAWRLSMLSAAVFIFAFALYSYQFIK